MHTTETLEKFIARVEENAHAEALEEFYTADSTMQENQAAPRVGRDAHVANEHKVLARAKSLVSKCVRPVFVAGDLVVIRWRPAEQRCIRLSIAVVRPRPAAAAPVEVGCPGRWVRVVPTDRGRLGGRARVGGPPAGAVAE